VDLAQNVSYVFIEVLKRMLYFALLVIGCAVGAVRSTRDQQLDDRPGLLLLYASIVAVAIFLVHNLIDFSMFEPGPMFVMAMLIGSILGIRSEDGSRRGARAIVAIATVAWLAAAIGFVGPTIAAEAKAQEGDDALRASDPARAARHFKDAFDTSPVGNSDYLQRAARSLVFAQAPATQVLETLDAAVRANPMSLDALRMRANFAMKLPRPDASPVIADYQRLTSLNPNDVQLRIEFAHALEQLGQPRRAADELSRALDYNDRLAPDEPKRLPPHRIDELRREIERLVRG
jgi:tetratricopeptide (TPR) repeat protein